jgi:hypothetical protein
MTCKIIFTVLFTIPVEPSRFASRCLTSWGHKAGGRSYATYILPHDIPPFLFPFPTVEKEREKK